MDSGEGAGVEGEISQNLYHRGTQREHRVNHDLIYPWEFVKFVVDFLLIE